MAEPQRPLETDSRFPSGPWQGFWLHPASNNQRGEMEIVLTFADEQLTGEGRDVVGEFLFKGRYSLESGECHFTKHYIGKHNVFYRGFNEGKGIWGLWEIRYSIPGGRTYIDKGGFHIWPEGMSDPTHSSLKTEEPIPQEELQLV